MASPQAEAFHEAVRQFREAALGSGAIPTIEEMRAGAEASMQMVGIMPEGVNVTEIQVAGRRALQLDPVGASTDHVILYLHGGGYVMNSLETHKKLAAGVAAATGCRAISFDYRLAPEDPFPAAVDDALDAYRWLLANGYAPSRIAVSGDSAGGGLTVATLIAARDAGLAQPAATATMSPWTDLEGTGATMTANEGVDLMIDRAAMTGIAAIYLTGADPRSALASVIYADLQGLAPMYIQVGGHETLLDDSTRLAVRGAHAGVDVRLDVFPEMQHVFQSGLGMLPESDEALSRIGAYLRGRFGLPPA